MNVAEMEQALGALVGLDVPLLVHAESDEAAFSRSWCIVPATTTTCGLGRAA